MTQTHETKAHDLLRELQRSADEAAMRALREAAHFSQLGRDVAKQLEQLTEAERK